MKLEFPCQIIDSRDLQVCVTLDQFLRAVILKADRKLSFFTLTLDVYDRAHAVFRMANARADQRIF